MSVTSKLDELEERLELTADALEQGDYAAAQEHASGLSDIMDCPLCEGLENGVLGGVLYASGMTPVNQEERTQQVADEIRRFLDTEMEEARDRLEQMFEAEV